MIEFDELPRATPPAIRNLLHRCLDRDVKKRLRNIGEARILLDEPSPVPPAPVRRWNPWIVAGALGIALLASITAWLRPGAANSNAGVAHFFLPLPPGTSATAHIMSTQVVPSPDGHFLALIARDRSSGRSNLWVRPLRSTLAQRLDNTVGAALPFWSPDSREIAFFTDGKLKRLPVSGGSVQTICDAPGDSDGGTWNQECVIVFAHYGPGSVLMRVPAAGGVPMAVAALEKDESWHSWPQFLPDGRHLLYFAVHQEAAEGAIYIQELGSTKRVLVLKNSTRGVFAPPGDLLFVRERTLLAQSIDKKTFQLVGEPVAVAQDVAFNEKNGRNAIAISGNGVLAYRGAAHSMRQLTWYDRQGRPLGTVGTPGEFINPSLSPDEKSVAVVMGTSGNLDAWVMDLTSGVITRMTRDSKVSIPSTPLWSPDSRRLAITQVNFKVQDVDLPSGKIAPLAKDCGAQDWLPDGSGILCTASGSGGEKLLLTGGVRSLAFPVTAYGRGDFRFSPDGQYVAYFSDESGQDEIYVASFPTFAPKRRISSSGGRHPLWAKGGKEIVYVTGDGTLMSAEIRTVSNLVAGTPKVLFKSTGFDFGRFAVTADGKRFLINELVQKTEGENPDITVVLNWAAGIR